jgi:glycosyltransferase involved in cell wall biosynthesis
MNFMAYGLPVVAVVDPGSEVSRVVDLAGAGWVADSADPDAFPAAVAEILGEPGQLAVRGAAAQAFADGHFSRAGFAAQFESVLDKVMRGDHHTLRL